MTPNFASLAERAPARPEGGGIPENGLTRARIVDPPFLNSECRVRRKVGGGALPEGAWGDGNPVEMRLSRREGIARPFRLYRGCFLGLLGGLGQAPGGSC